MRRIVLGLIAPIWNGPAMRNDEKHGQERPAHAKHGHPSHADESCFRCAASLTQPLVCEGCGLLHPPPPDLNPFQALGMNPAARIDAMDLRKRLSKLSRHMHPDFYVAQGEEARRLAEQNTAELNAAFEIVSDETRRIDWLIQAGDGPAPTEERQMPQEFLMEVLEWNETLEGAREKDAQALAALPALAEELQARLVRQRDALRELLTPLPPAGDERYVQARRQLNAVRYLERALAELAEQRLDRSKGSLHN